jgi:hypothetical protein
VHPLRTRPCITLASCPPSRADAACECRQDSCMARRRSDSRFARYFSRTVRNPCRCVDDAAYLLNLREFGAARNAGRERSCLRLTTLWATRIFKGLIFKDCACRMRLTVQWERLDDPIASRH